MSYILNALRKSERERQAKEQSANLQAPDSQAIPVQNSRVVWFLIIALVCINILVLIYFVFFNAQTAKSTITKNEKQSENIQPPKIIAELPAAVMTESKPNKADTINKQTPRPAFNPVSDKPNQQTSISDMLERKRNTIKPVITSTIKKNKKTTARNNKQENIPKKATTGKHTVQKTVSKPENRPQPIKKSETIPYLREMPPEFRRRVPNLNVNVFVYAEEPENRFVIIDMKKYRAGEETDSGVKIKDIKKESLILNFNNRSFQVKRP